MIQKLCIYVLDGRGATRKKRKVSGTSGFSAVSVSQLLAQRERNLTAGTPQGKEPAARALQVSKMYTAHLWAQRLVTEFIFRYITPSRNTYFVCGL